MIWNLIGKTLISSTTDALKHHLAKKKAIREVELETAKDIQVEHIKASKGSIKDEIILIWFLVMFSLPAVGESERFLTWAEVLKNLTSELFWIFSLIVCASFGLKIADLKKK